MIIPTFTKTKFVDENGVLTSQTQQAFDIFFQQAQESISNDGFVIPSQSTSQINYIASANNENSMPNGTMWYDSELNKLKVKINGTVRIITTS